VAECPAEWVVWIINSTPKHKTAKGLPDLGRLLLFKSFSKIKATNLYIPKKHPLFGIEITKPYAYFCSIILQTVNLKKL
jgi:hypothetical protein